MARFSLKLPSVVSTLSETKAKTEGTSTTYGQDIRMPGEFTTRSAEIIESAGGLHQSDTVVKVVEQTTKSVTTDCGAVMTGLRPEVKSNVAIAATSTNKGATVVVEKSEVKFSNPPPTTAQFSGQQTQQNLSLKPLPKQITDNLLTNVSSVAPNVVKQAIVVGSKLKPKAEIKKILNEAQKVDLVITLKSPMSEPIDFNTIKVPDLEENFVYNFFEPNEDEISLQEDLSEDPLLKESLNNVPKYVRLKWNATNLTEPIAGTDNSTEAKKKRTEVFGKSKGVAAHNSNHVPNSVEAHKKRIAPMKHDGQEKTLVDTHSPEVAFESTSNSLMFANSVVTSVMKPAKSSLVSLPLKSIKKFR